MFTCPKCNKQQHAVCGDKNCACYQLIPEGELPQIDRPVLGRVVIPRPLFNWLWRIVPNNVRWHQMVELIECPYCGFRGTHDYWFEREIEAAKAEGILP
jgi:hypothetical protein